MENKRKSERIPVACRVHVKGEDASTICITENISEGGLYLKINQPPYVGTMLELEISLPHTEELLRIPAEVVWRQEDRGCGLRFTRITQKNKSLIKDYLEQTLES